MHERICVGLGGAGQVPGHVVGTPDGDVYWEPTAHYRYMHISGPYGALPAALRGLFTF